MPLILAPLETTLKIVKLAGDEKTKKHLENLGLVVGGELKVLSRTSGGVLISVKESRLALDGNLAGRIRVA